MKGRRTSIRSSNGIKDKRQSFSYRGKEYNWRILEASLRNCARKKEKRITDYLTCSSENVIRVLYHTVCWCGAVVEEDEFVNDWKHGFVRFRLTPAEKGIKEIHRTLFYAARKFGL